MTGGDRHRRVEAAIARLTGRPRQVQVDLQPWWDAKGKDDDQQEEQITL